MSRKKIPPLLFLLFPLACAEAPAGPQSTIHDEAVDLAISTGDRSEEAFFAARGLLKAFSGAELVVGGVVRRVDTQYYGSEQRPLTVVTLDVGETLRGEKPADSTIIFWTWQDAESTAAQIPEGTEVAVGLLIGTGRKTSYTLAHPRALVAADAEQLFIPRLAPSRLAFSRSLKNLQGGAQ